MPTASAVPDIAPVAVFKVKPPGKLPDEIEYGFEPTVPEASHKSAAGRPTPLPLSNKLTVVSTAFVNVGVDVSAVIASVNSADYPEPLVTLTV